ncbi:MAG: hypothetical protein RXQ77_03510 [Candidatus Nanopusillus sp.]
MDWEDLKKRVRELRMKPEDEEGEEWGGEEDEWGWEEDWDLEEEW